MSKISRQPVRRRTISPVAAGTWLRAWIASSRWRRTSRAADQGADERVVDGGGKRRALVVAQRVPGDPPPSQIGPQAGACARRSASARRSAGGSCVRGGRAPPGRRPPASRRADPRARGSRRRGSAASRACEVECGSASHRRGLVSVSHAGCRGSALPRLRGSRQPHGGRGGRVFHAVLPCVRHGVYGTPADRRGVYGLRSLLPRRQPGGAAVRPSAPRRARLRLRCRPAAESLARRRLRRRDADAGGPRAGMGGDRDGGRGACGRGDARKGVRRQKRRARASSTCRRPRSTSSAASRSSSTCRT